MSNFKQAYQKFLNLAIALEGMSDFPQLDPIEQRLLALLSQYWLSKDPITVVSAMNMTPDISTSTIFRYLKKMRVKGYIQLVIDETDNRVKYITPTALTENYFNKMGKLMVKATAE
jgi:DNA-binding MarR family transcriptional regulator